MADDIQGKSGDGTCFHSTVREDLISKFIDVQEKELMLRGKEMELRGVEEDHQYQLNKTAMEYYYKHLTLENDHGKSVRLLTYIFCAIITIALLSFMGYCVHAGKEQLAMEIIKNIAFIAGGGLGGYALGLRKKISSPDSEP